MFRRGTRPGVKASRVVPVADVLEVIATRVPIGSISAQSRRPLAYSAHRIRIHHRLTNVSLSSGAGLPARYPGE